MPRFISIQRLIISALFSFPLVHNCYGQAGSQPRFEAASLKLSEDQALMGTRPELSPGRIVWTTQLQYLVSYAYDVDLARVSFAGYGMGTIYNLNAVFPPNTSQADLRLMLQALLADRFNLHAHRDTKEVAGFALIVAKAGIKMKESTDVRPVDSGGAAILPEKGSYVTATGEGPGVIRITAQAASIKRLTEIFGRITGTPISDQTGLTGRYNFQFRFSNINADAETDVPSFPTALQESMGLTLQKQKVPVETLVVDHLDPLSQN